MPRFIQPPSGFECSYRDSCPHLDGLSTIWVLSEYRRSDDQYQEHLRIIDLFDENLAKAQEHIRKLERENAQLKAKMKAMHMRQFKPNRKLSDKEKKQDVTKNLSSEAYPQAKKRGAPAGHPGWSRPKPSRIDRTVQVVAPEICPSCRSDRLTPLPEIIEHIQEDIVLCPRTVVTRYLHGQSYCHCCRQPVVKAAKSEILNTPIGPVAKAAAIYLRYNIGISYRESATDI